MAAALWGKVYYNNTFTPASYARSPAADACSPTTPHILNSAGTAIAFTLSTAIRAIYLRAGASSLLRQSGCRGLAPQCPGRALKVDAANRFALLAGIWP